MPKIEQDKLLFFKSGTDVERRWPPQMLATNIPGKMKFRVLVISFAGGAVRIGGLSRIQLKSTLSELIKLLPDDICLDQVFAMDPTGMSWYSYNGKKRNFTGWQTLCAELSSITPFYDCILMVGFCMGATAAAMISEKMNLAAGQQSILLLFNPQTEICSHLNPKYRIASWFLDRSVADKVLGRMRHLLALRASPDMSETNPCHRCYFHFSDNPLEGQQAGRLLGGQGCSLADSLASSPTCNYVTSPLKLRRDYSVAVHLDCPGHALLRHLRDNSDLLYVLKFHIMNSYHGEITRGEQ